ncbi:PssE/Cps14G family polysaccharide biosynthesis glycosyltransferase [Paenibacillus sp. YYML68]|uniref:PssE/Cps14G family polysaccharide biosynthesis glycosyltransferase n=1 Tax=Paenibacillus sp. YYML68 TaxID=2909250 RepID=UPI002492F737|nr:PssE/Cps14G family polysaccharide biosynthesis glycosyltransferase [Paenibacillus sp. YYML68]
MILVSLGTQDFPFNRLLEEIDRLIDRGFIQEDVFAQVGYSQYEAKHYRTQKFTDFNQFDELLDQCSILITHGGTGTIVSALKKGKKIIAVPRLKKHNEHVDDHQTEIIELFSKQNLIIGLNEVAELEQALQKIHSMEFNTFVSGNETIIQIIDDFIKEI